VQWLAVFIQHDKLGHRRFALDPCCDVDWLGLDDYGNGGIITVTGVSPANWNGTFIVTASSSGSVSYLDNSATGSYSSGGTVVASTFTTNATASGSAASSTPLDGGGGGAGNGTGGGGNGGKGR